MSTYTLISSQVLGSSAASVTFSSIPSTYKDLVIRYSARLDAATTASRLSFNGDSATNYSDTAIYGNGSSASSTLDSSQTYIRPYASTDSSAMTTNTFASAELYIPNYAASTNKPLSNFGVTEDNSTSTAVIIAATAALWRNTSAITSITFTANTGNYVSGSSFYLYGI